MGHKEVLEATSGIVTLLEQLDSDERARVFQAVHAVLGETELPLRTAEVGGGDEVEAGKGDKGGAGGGVSAKEYFDLKDPKSVSDKLATAARYREEHQGADTNSKAEIKTILQNARRNFDSGNYSRDMGNARIKGLFNTGGDKGTAMLSHYGQKYVDALPDQKAAKAIPKPRKRKAAKKTSKKTAKKASKKTARK